MNRYYDVAVIGSGIGGLVIASLLSEKNRVLVLEKNKDLGGYCSSFEIDGYNFESAVQALNGFSKEDPVYEALSKAKALEGLNIYQPVDLYRTVFPDYDIKVPQKNLQKYERMLASLFPDEAVNVSGLFQTMKCIYMEMSMFHREKSLKKSPYVLKYGRLSSDQLVSEFINSDKLKAIILQYWLYRGLPPRKLAATTFSYIWYDYTVNGSYCVENGMAGLINNLAENIRSNGSEVITNSEVSRISCNNSRIESLSLKDGTLISAGTFISNIDVFKTFEIIEGADAYLEEYVSKLRENALSISAFKIYLGLDIDVKELGIDDYEIYLNPTYDAGAMYNASIENDLGRATCSITIYPNAGNRSDGNGQSVVSIGLLSGYDYWKSLSRDEYKLKKESLSDLIISRCETVIPGLRSHIKRKIVATPLTMERYTGNSRGSIYGWSTTTLKDEVKFMSPTTPLKNLFLSSHWTKIGGGVAGVVLSADRVYNLLSNSISPLISSERGS